MCFVSCKKTYKYYVKSERVDSFGETKKDVSKPLKIKAENDTIAYRLAYERFVLMIKIKKDMVNKYGKEVVSVPKSFKIENSKGENIKYNIPKKYRESLEKQIEDSQIH